MEERLEAVFGEFGREQGPLGTSAWCKLITPQGEVIAFSVGDDHDDALRAAAEFAGFHVVGLDSSAYDSIHTVGVRSEA